MSRRFARVERGKDTPRFTKCYLEFFKRSVDFSGLDIVIDKGFLESRFGSKADMDDEKFSRLDRFASEALYSSIVDNFQCFLTDLLMSLFRERPELLSGGRTENRFIFQHADMDSLKRSIIDKHILDLGYKSIESLDQYFSENFKFSLTKSKLQSMRLSRILQIRHVIAHNRGLVSKQFLYKCGAKIDSIDMPVTLPNLMAVDHYLIMLARQVDADFINKFDIKSIPRTLTTI